MGVNGGGARCGKKPGVITFRGILFVLPFLLSSLLSLSLSIICVLLSRGDFIAMLLSSSLFVLDAEDEDDADNADGVDGTVVTIDEDGDDFEVSFFLDDFFFVLFFFDDLRFLFGTTYSWPFCCVSESSLL